MKLFSSNTYANVTATLALAIAFGGGGYAAATSLHHHKTKGPADNTAPVAVISVNQHGKLMAEKHEAPATGAPKVKSPSKGLYIVHIPGVSYYNAYDAAVCTPQNFTPLVAEVDGAGKNDFAVDIFDAEGTYTPSDFKCAIWNLKNP
jgi:hypothetical protein